MSKLDDLGLNVSRNLCTSSSDITIQGISLPTGSDKTTILTIDLQRTPSVQGSFKSEGLLQKIGKLFKSELQTGDPVFDDAVLIETSTPDSMKVFLADEHARSYLRTLVAVGPVVIQATKLTLTVPGHTFEHDDGVAVFIGMLMR